jgi:ABC-type Na+ transport system ATPase subunit NatA
MGIYSDLTGHEILKFLERIGDGKVSKEHRHNLTERFELSDRDLSRKLREYSTGMKRKLGLIQAFQADPLLLNLRRVSIRSCRNLSMNCWPMRATVAAPFSCRRTYCPK